MKKFNEIGSNYLRYKAKCLVGHIVLCHPSQPSGVRVIRPDIPGFD